MKKYISILTGTVIAMLVLSSCEDRKFQTFIANVPVYMSYEDLREAVAVEDPIPMAEPGKIYFKDNFIFINEYMKGIHVVDIEDPSAPDPVSFINIPGNVDMAIKDNILYADSYIDLVLVDVSDPGTPVENGRIDSILSYTLPPYDEDYPLAEIDNKEGVVTGWEVKEHKQQIHSHHYPYPIYWGYEDMLSSSLSSVRPMAAGTGSTYGIGGSMARFTTYDNYLYMLEESSTLKIFDISNLEAPSMEYEKYAGWGLETMFIYEGYMYIGAMDGMYIYDLEFPNNPVHTAMYRHVTSCDPVVVSGNTAYVTLRSGTTCGGTADLLDVIDVSDKWDPERIASYPMNQPYGLGISNDILFICQGENGLVVYDASNPRQISNNKLAEFNDIQATDVIPLDTLLFTIGDGGFLIYDYSDLEDIQLLSTLGSVEE